MPATNSTVIAGLVPAISIHELRNLVIEIAPSVVLLGDETGFVNPRPVFDIFLTLNCQRGRIVNFEMDELFDSVSFGMARNQSILVLVDAAHEIVGDANIDRTTRTARENVDVELPQELSFANRDRRDKPGDDSGVWETAGTPPSDVITEQTRSTKSR